jgi:undecaprenyl-diphosphatase
MNLLSVVILGVVEGLTEFLPISSTGHLILTSTFLKLPSSEFLKSFEIFIQLGAILAIVILYWKSLVLDRIMIQKILVAFLPTAVIGYLLYKPVKAHLLGNSHVVLWALFLGGIVMILLEIYNMKKNNPPLESKAISYPQALLIGIFQSLAIIPGVSRSAATIMGGLALGIHRKAIVEFSFLLAVPTLAAATALDLYKSGGSVFNGQWPFLLLGLVVSFSVAVVAVKGLILFIQKYNFIPFGIYRILLAMTLWFIL